MDITAYKAWAWRNKAVKVFLVGTQRFPKSPNAWDSLGEAYSAKGDKENAIKSFKKSTQLKSFTLL